MPDKKKILVIEDEKPMAHAMELKLTRAGFDVATAGNGEEGLTTLHDHPVDLILMDLIMPKRDGFSVLEELKRTGNSVPVIVLSNLSQAEDEHRAKALGATDFFIKSNTPLATIVERVQSILHA
jgi:two-component system, OmpR family, copper resistance phosphate regulon response regulator CusR